MVNSGSGRWLLRMSWRKLTAVQVVCSRSLRKCSVADVLAAGRCLAKALIQELFNH